MLQHKFFYNRFVLWEYLKDFCDGLDYNKTLQLPILWFADSDKNYSSMSAKEFITKLNERFGTNFSAKHSARCGQKFTLFWEDETDAVEPTVTVDLIADEQPVVDGVKTSENKPNELTDEDLKWIDSLENTKEDKLKLDKFAYEQFGVKLSRAMKLENMIITLKDELASKQ